VERVADFIFRYLADQGAETIFVLTGNGSMHMNDAIVKEPRLKYVCARNEAAAPVMASAYSRVSNRIGVVSVTSGPGATNAVAGLAEAWVDSSPVIIISGQSPTNELPAAGLKPVRTFGTAGVDIISVVKPITKYAATVFDPTRVRAELERAVFEATTGRPGPVWLDVPMDVQSAEIDPSRLEGFSVPLPKSDEFSLESQINQLSELIQAAERPFVIAGQGVRQAAAVDDLLLFLNQSGIPFGLTRLGQDMIPRSHPNNLGHLGRRGAPSSKSILGEADLVLALGARLATQLAGQNLSHFAPSAKVVMVDIDEAEIEKFGERLSLAINADVKQFLTAANRKSIRINKEFTEDWIGRCEKTKVDSVVAQASDNRSPMDLYFFMSTLDRVSGSENILITDAGSNYYVGGQVYDFENGQREVTSGTFAAMGTGVPLGIGAAIGAPRKQVLAVTGDGSVELNIQELKTISYYQLNMKLFVINNGGYASMRNWQDTFFEGRRIGSDDDTGAEGLNLEAVAKAFDLDYLLLENPDTLEADLHALVKQSGPMFVEVVCNPNQRIVQPFEETEESS
jgi:acetolactate synthase I/II/III large subunit